MMLRVFLVVLSVLALAGSVHSHEPMPNYRCNVTVTPGGTSGSQTCTCNQGGSVTCAQWQTFTYSYFNPSPDCDPAADRICEPGNPNAYSSVDFKVVCNAVTCSCTYDVNQTQNETYTTGCIDIF